MFAYLKEQFETLPLPDPSTTSLSGQTIILIGANRGLGYELALHLARFKPGRLILGCRNIVKGKDAVNSELFIFILSKIPDWRDIDIQKETGCDTLEAWQIDYASFQSVKDFVQRVQDPASGIDKLDILIHCAAVVGTKYEQTVDGWENV